MICLNVVELFFKPSKSGETYENVRSRESTILPYPMDARQDTKRAPRHEEEEPDIRILISQILGCRLDNQRCDEQDRTDDYVARPRHLPNKENVSSIFILKKKAYQFHDVHYPLH